MSADAARPQAPALAFLDPECSVCGDLVSVDSDGYLCENCGIWWHRDGSFDQWCDR